MEDLQLLIDLHIEGVRQGPGGDAETRRAIELSGLRNRHGLKIADIGCGTGAFEIALLEKGIAFRKLYAVDIDKVALDFLSWMLGQVPYGGKENIETVLSSMEDVMLPPESIDVAVLINMSAFHAWTDDQGELTFSGKAEQCLRTLYSALKPGAKVASFSFDTASESSETVLQEMTHLYKVIGLQQIEQGSFMSGDQQNYYALFKKN